MEEVSRNSKLIPANSNNLNNCFENEELLFSNYFSDDYEIWSKIQTYSQIEKFLKKQSLFPLRIICLPKNIESIKLKEINQKNQIKNEKFEEIKTTFNHSLPLKSDIYQKD